MDGINIKQGNVVWVKLKGYSWWPGVVSDLCFNNRCIGLLIKNIQVRKELFMLNSLGI